VPGVVGRMKGSEWPRLGVWGRGCRCGCCWDMGDVRGSVGVESGRVGGIMLVGVGVSAASEGRIGLEWRAMGACGG
jgi:hypothetical protein